MNLDLHDEDDGTELLDIIDQEIYESQDEINFKRATSEERLFLLPYF